MATDSDRAITAITHDGAFRVIVARTTQTVRQAIEAQEIEGANATNLADLVTGAILVRLTMAPTLRVQGIVRGAGGRGTLVGDSHPDGWARGLIQRPGGLKEVSLGPGALMQVMRTMPNGAVHQGVVEVPDDGVSGAVMSYMQSSEQIECVVSVGTLMEQGRIVAAGAFIVQLLPEVSRDPLARMVDRLQANLADRPRVLRTIEAAPETLLDEILAEMPYEQTQEATLRFGCQCSSVRVLASLASLPKSDIQELMQSEEQLWINCDYCGQKYEMSPKALRGLLESS
ncbi:MAG: Hsp33 family molecular chaperone HslO [Sandaracinaceae bacterium]|nr:Hsp33 family molecular chaperone HslO [Sandaracinaceae bacterium]